MAHTFFNLSFEFSGGTGGQHTSAIVAPFALLDGDELRLNVGATSVVLVFAAVDGLTAAAAVAAITGQSPLVAADVVVDGAGDHVRVTSLVPGETAEFEVLGGRAQSAFAFPRGIVLGITHPGSPWSWTSVGASTATEGLEFDDLREPDFESYTYGYGFTVDTAEFAALKFFDGGLESFKERYNEHEPGWVNRLGEPNPTVSELFVGTGTIEPYDDYGTPAPAFDVEVFDQGATEDYDADFTTPAPVFENLTFAGTLAEGIEKYDRLDRGTHEISLLDTSLVITITIDTVNFTVTPGEVSASGVPPSEEDKFAAQLLKSKIEAAESLVAVGASVDFSDLGAVLLYLFPRDPTATPAITANNATRTSLPRLTNLTEVWHFKDSFPPDSAQP